MRSVDNVVPGTYTHLKPPEVRQVAIADAAVDITGAQIVSISVNKRAGKVWINVDGICALRLCRVKNITYEEA